MAFNLLFMKEPTCTTHNAHLLLYDGICLSYLCVCNNNVRLWIDICLLSFVMLFTDSQLLHSSIAHWTIIKLD